MGYVSSKDAAKLLRISQSHVKYLLQRGELQGIKIGRDWLLPTETLHYQRKRRPKRKKMGESR